jgi:carbonic anhydrase
LETTIKANVENVVKILHASEPILKVMVEKKKLEIKGAYCDLDIEQLHFSMPSNLRRRDVKLLRHPICQTLMPGTALPVTG